MNDTVSENKKSWAQLIVGIVLGAIVTGFVQFALNQQLKINAVKTAKIEGVRKYLQTKLDKREKAYSSILPKIETALRPNSTETDREIAVRALRTELPFFQPRSKTQQRLYESSKQIGIVILEAGRQTDFDREMLFDTLKRDFQEDLWAIEVELNHFDDKLNLK
ncbi:MAG: hypothetical protein GY797_36230 [Deltaproteobacteria bacterium]|nr:hypothetical protein [Deltaproteobacteria bacterium]